MIDRAACIICVAVGFAASAALGAEENVPLTLGRYQIVGNPQSRADTFLLDTAAG